MLIRFCLLIRCLFCFDNFDFLFLFVELRQRDRVIQLQKQAQVLQEIGDHDRAESLLIASLGLIKSDAAAAATSVATTAELELDLAFTYQSRFETAGSKDFFYFKKYQIILMYSYNYLNIVDIFNLFFSFVVDDDENKDDKTKNHALLKKCIAAYDAAFTRLKDIKKSEMDHSIGKCTQETLFLCFLKNKPLSIEFETKKKKKNSNSGSSSC